MLCHTSFRAIPNEIISNSAAVNSSQHFCVGHQRLQLCPSALFCKPYSERVFSFSASTPSVSFRVRTSHGKEVNDNMTPSKEKKPLPPLSSSNTTVVVLDQPITYLQWHTALQQVKIIYLNRQYKQCASRCTQLLSTAPIERVNQHSLSQQPCPISKLIASRSTPYTPPSSTSTPPSATKPSRAQPTTSPPPNHAPSSSRANRTKPPPLLSRDPLPSPSPPRMTKTTTTKKKKTPTPARAPSQTPRPRTPSRARTPQTTTTTTTTSVQPPPTPPPNPLPPAALHPQPHPHLPQPAQPPCAPPPSASARKPSTSPRLHPAPTPHHHPPSPIGPTLQRPATTRT